MDSSSPSRALLHDSNEKLTTTTTAIRPSRLPLREINNVATTASRRIAQAKPRDQRHRGSIDFPMPIHNTKGVSSRDQHQFPQYSQPLLQTTLPAATSHTRYSKPYSVANFAPKSHLPHSNLKPAKPAPISGPLQSKSSPSQSTVIQHKSKDSTQSRTRAIHRALPNPKAAPPDSDIADIWSEVQAHISTMNYPTTTSQIVTDTQLSDNNTQLERTLGYLNVEPEPGFHPQLCTSVSPAEAPIVSATLGKHIRDGIEASAYMVVVNLTFFRSPGMPLKNANDSSDSMNAPSIEKIVLDFQSIPGHDSQTAGILFALAADDTWNDKFPRDNPSLLKKAGLFSPKSTCSDFLAVIGSSDASYKMDSLRKTWGDRAKAALTKQLSIRRADTNEDKWEILTHTRYYGYLVAGMQLQICEMSYNLQAPPPVPESRPQPVKPKSHSEPGTKIPRTEDTTNIKQGGSIIPKLKQKPTPPFCNKSSNPRDRLLGPDNAENQTLPFAQVSVKRFDLRRENDIVQFTAFHHALMRWAQARFCAQYVANLHGLCWQTQQEDENPWFVSNAEMIRYWTSATAPEPASTVSGQAVDAAVGATTSAERAGMAETKAWGAPASGSMEGRMG